METRLFSNRDLQRLIIPIIVEQFLLIFVGLADSIMVASVGEAAVSAVSLIDTIMVLLINAFAAIGIGGGVVAGQALGRKKPEEGCEATEQLLLFCTAFSILIMAVLYLGKGFVLHVVFGKIDAEVMRNCSIYLMIVNASIPFIALYNAGAAVFRAMGDSKTAMYMSVLMNGLNIAGNAVMIYGLKMGVAGAAIPTMLSRVVGGAIMLCLLKNPSKILHVRSYIKIRPDFRMMKKIFHIGIPYGLENSMFQLGKILVLSLVSGFGTVSIAANAVCNCVCGFAVVGGMSMGYALSSVTARCVGAGDYEQVRYYSRKLLALSYAALVIMNAILMLLLPAIIRIYNLSQETGEIATKIIIYHAICSCLWWAPSFTLPNTLRAANDATFCMITAILSMWIFRIAFSYLLALTFDLGVFGVWVAMTIDWLVRAVVFVFRYRSETWYFKTV